MITDGVMQLFVRTLASHKHVKRGAITRFEGDTKVPADVVRVLEHVGGWKYGDLRFTDPAQLEQERTHWTGLVGDFEAGTSDIWNHAFWNPAWIPLATSAAEVHAYDPIGCFGGSPHQVVTFDFKGGETWRVYTSLSAWLSALTEGLEHNEGKDATAAAHTWARANNTCVDVKLPTTVEERRAPQRFLAGIGDWTVLRHADGRVWSIRERRDGYELRIGEGEDAVTRKRTAPNPTTEVRRLIREQKAEGFERGL